MRNLIFFMIVIFFFGCGGSSSNEASQKIELPSKIDWYWQLQGDLNKTIDAKLYDIDLFDSSKEIIKKLHNDDKIVICYFSAGTYEDWRDDKDRFQQEDIGNNLDEWEGEKWLDIRSKNVRNIMKERLDLAKEKGCDGIEADNVDGYTNDTGFNITDEEQLNYNKFLAEEAKKRGLLIGLKNDLNQIESLVDYFDFALNEQCHKFNECDKLKPFVERGKPVLNAEYDKQYRDDDNITILCNQSEEQKFNTLILPLNLDGSFEIDCKNYLYKKFRVGYGGASAFKFYDNRWINSYDLMFGKISGDKFQELSNYLKQGKYVSIWITNGWKEEWIDLKKVQKFIDNGKIPVFIYFWFGDKLMNGLSDDKIDEYLTDVKRVDKFLSTLKGEYFIILEPEFNKKNIVSNKTEQMKFIDVMENSIKILKKDNRKLSLCMMDTGDRDINLKDSKCGYSNCALGDKFEWSKTFPIYDKLIDKLDFLSFQEMIGQFSRDPSNPGSWDNPNPIAYSDDKIGIDYLPQRVDNFAKFLKDRYKKPVFLPYIAIATATWNDDNEDGVVDNDEIDKNGWVEKAENVYKNLYSKNLFGYSVMELFDNPTHDKGGYQFFMQNEYHLGIVGGEIKNQQLTDELQFKGKVLDYIFQNRGEN